MTLQLQKRLEAKGWKIGSVKEFLKLTKEEAVYIERKLILSENRQKSQKRTQSRKDAE